MKYVRLSVFILALFFLNSCQTPPPATVPATQPLATLTVPQENYPIATADERVGYPQSTPSIILSAVPDLPDPAITIPVPQANVASIGGVLIRELTDNGFIPLTPDNLYLADILLTDSGEPAYIRANSQSPRAQLLPTGIFLFTNVPPGTYGLFVDVTYTEFPVLDEQEQPMLITVEAGDMLDLGQVITILP